MHIILPLHLVLAVRIMVLRFAARIIILCPRCCSSNDSSQRLDQVLDCENNGVPLHLGKIADSMYEWEGPVADHL